MWDDQKIKESRRGGGGNANRAEAKSAKDQWHTRRHACERSLTLMWGEGQRWCIRWRVKLLWVTLSCRVSSAQTHALPRCLSGDTRAFLLQNPGTRRISSILHDDVQDPETRKTTFSARWPRCIEIKGCFLKKKKNTRCASRGYLQSKVLRFLAGVLLRGCHKKKRSSWTSGQSEGQHTLHYSYMRK